MIRQARVDDATGLLDLDQWYSMVSESEWEETLVEAEDEEMVSALRDVGYTPFQAGDGLEGLRVFKSNASSIQIVVADLELPDMQGTDCLERIRAESPEVGGLVITGRPDAADLLPPGGRTTYSVLHKPFQMKELRLVISRILGQRSPALP